MRAALSCLRLPRSSVAHHHRAAVGLPGLAELTVLYLDPVTVSRLKRNATVKAEIALRGFERGVPAGFLCYPVSQAADITGFRATLVPVGDDQLPMIQLTNEIATHVNRMAGYELLPRCRALLSRTSRLPGVDGRKGSAYLDAFDSDDAGVEALKAGYRRGGIGDAALKRHLRAVLEDMLEPIRERRAEYAARPREVVVDRDPAAWNGAGGGRIIQPPPVHSRARLLRSAGSYHPGARLKPQCQPFWGRCQG